MQVFSNFLKKFARIYMKARLWNLVNSITYIIAECGQAIQDTLAKLGDFNDVVRDTDNGLNRIKDKLCGLEKDPTDSKSLDSIKGLMDDSKGLEKNLR